MLPAAMPTQSGRFYDEKITSHIHPTASLLSVIQYTMAAQRGNVCKAVNFFCKYIHPA